MSSTFWGFPIEPSLYTEAKEAIRATQDLGKDDLAQGTKVAFDLVSKLIFAGVGSYYHTPVKGQLPPLPANVDLDDAAQTVGLGLVFVAGRYLQGRSVQELKDLADYLGRLLREHPLSGRPCLAFPLSVKLEQRLRDLLERVRQKPVAAEFRAEIRTVVIQIVEASVVYYFQHPRPQAQPDLHLQQVIFYGVRELSDMVDKLVDQVLPSLPPEHLIHFTHYVEAMIFKAPDTSPGGVSKTEAP